MPLIYGTAFYGQSQTLATAIRLNGVNQRLQRTIGTGTEFTSVNRNQASHSIWFRVPTLGISNPLFTVDNGAGGSSIAIRTANDIRVFEQIVTNPPYRDGTTSMEIEVDTWHHLFVQIDTAATDVLKIWLDGVLGFSGNTNTTGSTWGLQTLTHSIGYRQNTDTYFQGDLALMHWVDGQALLPTDFADVIDGIYQAVPVTPTYDLNGHFMNFADPDDLGADADNGWTYTLSNITAADAIGDGPPTSY